LTIKSIYKSDTNHINY